MSWRRLLGVCAFVGALAGVAACSMLLGAGARSLAPAPAHASHTVADVRGDGASQGDVRTTTLHAAHLRGAEPVACADCHTIDPDGFTRPDRVRCLRCHADRKAALHTAVDDAKAKECTSCHDFLDRTPTEDRAWKCGRCHTRPHDAPLPDGDLADVCGRCHSPHGEAAVAPPSCARCHPQEAQANQHQGGVGGSKACFDCHKQHDPVANAALRCAPCHADRGPHVPSTALFAGGHTTCTGCHQPHAFDKKNARPCTTCHVGQVAIAASFVGTHQSCRSCHDQHDVPTSAAKSCRRCHADKQPKHPTFDGGDACLGCHPAHPGQGGGAIVALACSSCHQKASSDRAFHRGARCTQCHKEHDFKLTLTPSFCLGCHSERVGPRRAIVTSTGHSDCTRCHGGDPHDPKKPPACGTCHAEQASTVPDGHKDCKQCHDPHDGELRPGVKTCVGCHTDRKNGPHGGIAGGCENCHRPHGPGGHESPPTCTTCHDRGKLAFTHQASGHANCTSCHVSHKFPSTITRDTCMKCHTDRKDHEPNATTCVGCHPFRKGEP